PFAECQQAHAIGNVVVSVLSHRPALAGGLVEVPAVACKRRSGRLAREARDSHATPGGARSQYRVGCVGGWLPATHDKQAGRKPLARSVHAAGGFFRAKLSPMPTSKKPPKETLRRWRVTILRSRAHNLGTIEAPDAKTAEAEAVKLFGLDEE